MSILRRLAALALPLLAVAAGPAQAQSADTVRIGYQKSSTLITVLKTQGTLEKLFEPQGIKVSWHEFTSGLPLLEALNVGGIDLSADVADTVPIFAQAAKADLTYFAREAPSPTAQAIIVRADSPVQSVADLKGKRVGFAKAAGAHYLLIAALEKDGLGLGDVTQAFLTPADGRAAFERGAIDAWSIWDPFLSAVQQQDKVRVLADGTDLANYQRYYLASTPFLAKNPAIVRSVYDELDKAGQWVKAEPQAAAELLSPVWGLPTEVILAANARRSYDVQPVQSSNLDEQQRIADSFFAEKLLPARIVAREAPLWQPGAGQ